MKKILAFSILSFSIFSCENDKNAAQADSLRNDSAMKAISASNPTTNSNLARTDTAFIATLPPVMEGDLVFQNASDEQSIAFGAATKSKYNNVGVIFIRPKDQSYMVLDARDSVHGVPLSKWMAEGKDHRVALLRLKNANMILNEKKTDQMKFTAKAMRGRKYDPYFSWDDNTFYSSEMAWKLYKIGGKIELSTPEKLSQFDLSGTLVKQQLKEKYGANIPKDEQVVSPDNLYHSQRMEIIYEK